VKQLVNTSDGSLIGDILSIPNFTTAAERVMSNKGAPGVDGMPVDEWPAYLRKHGKELKQSIRNWTYTPKPVRRVEIPKPGTKAMRPLGIPTVVDRVVQTATEQVLSPIWEPTFSEHSYGYRPNRSCHDAMKEVLGYLNDGYIYVVDIDIKAFFDTVNHDKLISLIREKVNDRDVLHLVRQFLKSGVMDCGLVKPSEEGVPQGGAISPLLSNIYLDPLDKELEARGLRFARYADDVVVFTKSSDAADRVMASVTSWIERKLYLQVSPTKTKVVTPTKSEYLGFGFWKSRNGWRCKPLESRKQRLVDKVRAVTCRRKAIAIPLSQTVTKINQIVGGWINYYAIGDMKVWLQNTMGPWLRHRVRAIMLKQWKKPAKIMKSLRWYCICYNLDFSDQDLYKVAYSSRGWYARANGDVVNFILSPTVLGTALYKGKGSNKTKVYPGLINPLLYYQSRR
jgi:group II intron reverse transcriptase/maturase